MLNRLNLAIVGHANAGKTSLLRTLTRDSQLGIVIDEPGSTRHVEEISFTLEHNQTIAFYDTPGLEDSIALYDYIQQFNYHNNKSDGVDKLNQFLASPEAQHRFEQEAKVIRQLLKSDVAIYVIDVREPTLDKYHDELALLAYSDKPILAILNFTVNPSEYEQDWKKLLSRVGIHAIIRFDAVFPSLEGEQRLYQSLLLLVEPAKTLLTLWQQQLIEQQVKRSNAANLIIAETLIDITAYNQQAKDDSDALAKLMQDKVRNREQKAIDDLLDLYQFKVMFDTKQQLPLLQGRFSSDLFNQEALKIMGISLSKGVVSGAAIGVGIDLAVGGITLGSAALIGATIGGLSQAAKNYSSKIKQRLSGYSTMSIDDEIICFLSLRLLQLKTALDCRSHGNSAPIALAKIDEKQWKKGKLPKSLQAARAHADWSTLNNKASNRNEYRQQLIEKLAQELV